MPVFRPTSVILYVEDVEVSTAFYRTILSKEPSANFVDFAVFALSDDITIGLQTKDQIEPVAVGGPGCVELSMSYASSEEVSEIYRDWRQLGVQIVLEPCVLEFGYTFVATDPDGHRLRVCATEIRNL